MNGECFEFATIGDTVTTKILINKGPEELFAERIEQKVKVMVLKNRMEGHADKLRAELAEAERVQAHYRNNELFGAF